MSRYGQCNGLDCGERYPLPAPPAEGDMSGEAVLRRIQISQRLCPYCASTIRSTRRTYAASQAARAANGGYRWNSEKPLAVRLLERWRAYRGNG